MKRREFLKIIKELSINGKLSIEKIEKIDDELKNKLIFYIVRNRQPIVKNFINDSTDKDWLASMGYLYNKMGKLFEFLCTCENQNLIRNN